MSSKIFIFTAFDFIDEIQEKSPTLFKNIVFNSFHRLNQRFSTISNWIFQIYKVEEEIE